MEERTSGMPRNAPFTVLDGSVLPRRHALYSAICENAEGFTSALLIALPNRLVPRVDGVAQPVNLEPMGGWVKITAYPVAVSRDQIMVLRAGIQVTT